MCYLDVILLSDVISSIGPTISDADTNSSLIYVSLLKHKTNTRLYDIKVKYLTKVMLFRHQSHRLPYCSEFTSI